MDKLLIVLFPGTGQTRRADVGGKAASLIRMSEAGIRVPSGVVLTTTFFAPWFDTMKATPEWTRLVEASPEEWTPLCDALKQHAESVPLSTTQQDALNTVLEDLSASGDGARLAVRSSSPEEDLAAASFAGEYETRLGVRPDGLERAVRACFASSLDARVFTYKRQHGLDLWAPRIAVIVQRQIASEIAGVGFSLNPVTNDYDEAVIDSNWGLGTSIVDGRASPDHFVVDKVGRHVLEATPGAKQLSVWLDPEQGTVERESHRSEERTLTDAQLRELTGVICRIEDLYDTPIDIEWAYADGKLHVLQARPITAYVPLPPEMVTEPGARRRLYADGALSKGMTTNTPISPLGLDSMKGLFSAILETRVGPMRHDIPPEESLFFFAGGRMYVNYSNMMWLASPMSLAKSSAPTDALMAEILADVDDQQYRTATRPPWLSVRLLGLITTILWNLRSFFGNVLSALLSPERAYRTYRRMIVDLESELRQQIDADMPLDDLRRTYGARMANEMFDEMMSVVLVGMLPTAAIVRGKSADTKALADKLKLGVTGDVVVEMGIEMYRLAALLDRSDIDDLDRLAERIERREASQEFLNAWDSFHSDFGWRGPQEMDLASPRYADDPRLALRQMSYMAVDDAGFNPESAHQRLVAEREEAYEALLRRLGPLRRRLLRWIYRRIDLFAGTRDTPKHLLVLFNYVVRRRALAEGRRLVEEGRLDAAEDVFGLTFDDLKMAAADPALDLRKVYAERTRFHKKLQTHVRTFPAVIDSRGRILRPPRRDAAPGVLSGMPVSPGVVTGPVKILNTPHEKVVEKGDVLVAYTTDPGWTPLFVNAGAIVLEVGGVLQHGAVVAREYGKPCVVGIDRIVTNLRDGELVEVNGTTGTVRLLSQS